LLADDSVTAQNMGRRILTDAGYEVITVNNGSAALKKIHEVRPDLIILDVYMPGYGGLEVCQRLKESGETMKIPVLLSVGKMEPFKADEAKRVRADAHIVKPFDASELLAALAKLEDRIVPQESSRGRKSKKPSFWHDEESPAATDWSDNAQRLAQLKDRKPEIIEQAIPEPRAEEPVEAKVPEVGAFPLVREATGELPVVPDSQSVSSDDESGTMEAAVVVSPASDQPQEGMPVASSGLSKDESETAATAIAESSDAPAVSGSRWIAENVALSPEEAALELEQEMRAAEVAETKQVETSSAVNVPDRAPESVSTEKQGATFAAAAGASGTTSASSAVAVATANEEREAPATSEAAAAWQNWQQIRDTVMNTQSTEAIAETVAQAAKAGVPSNQEVTAAPEPESRVAEASAAEQPSTPTAEPSELDGALASIVDSVLAELKPKLMQEISKKLRK